jgi:prevent-host-death family protein
MEPITSADARTQFSDILAKAYYQNKTFVIQRCNRPMAVLMSIEEFEKLKNANPDNESKARRKK